MTQVLAVGQWLGTENKIIRMGRYRKRGWYVTDSTGETYTSVDYPEGLKTADDRVSGTLIADRGRTPWPDQHS